MKKDTLQKVLASALVGAMAMSTCNQLIEFILNQFQFGISGIIHIIGKRIPTSYRIEQGKGCKDGFKINFRQYGGIGKASIFLAKRYYA